VAACAALQVQRLLVRTEDFGSFAAAATVVPLSALIAFALHAALLSKGSMVQMGSHTLEFEHFAALELDLGSAEQEAFSVAPNASQT
jgi:hypothetical protein